MHIDEWAERAKAGTCSVCGSESLLCLVGECYICFHTFPKTVGFMTTDFARLAKVIIFCTNQILKK